MTNGNVDKKDTQITKVTNDLRYELDELGKSFARLKENLSSISRQSNPKTSGGTPVPTASLVPLCSEINDSVTKIRCLKAGVEEIIDLLEI